jgi:aspartate aminotransferase-like enzyme
MGPGPSDVNPRILEAMSAPVESGVAVDAARRAYGNAG